MHLPGDAAGGGPQDVLGPLEGAAPLFDPARAQGPDRLLRQGHQLDVLRTRVLHRPLLRFPAQPRHEIGDVRLGVSGSTGRWMESVEEAHDGNHDAHDLTHCQLSIVTFSILSPRRIWSSDLSRRRHLAEDGVAAVEVRLRREGDEELAAAGVGAGEGHADGAPRS